MILEILAFISMIILATGIGCFIEYATVGGNPFMKIYNGLRDTERQKAMLAYVVFILLILFIAL